MTYANVYATFLQNLFRFLKIYFDFVLILLIVSVSYTFLLNMQQAIFYGANYLHLLVRIIV